MVYFLIVNYYASEYIANLINSIDRDKIYLKSVETAYIYSDYKIIIINNSPDDNPIHRLQADNIIIIEAGNNIGFGQACNLGLNWIYNQDNQAIVWMINPDTYLLPNTLEKVPAFFVAHPEVSILGTIIYTPNGDIWFGSGEFIPEIGEIKILTKKDCVNVDLPYFATTWVSGCSLLVNLSKFTTCPQFDPSYFLYYEDFDFCRRYANQGHLIAMTHQIGLVHEASAITGRNMISKFKYSTYSYLLTIERYTSKIILMGRLMRLILNAVYLMLGKPQVALGKLQGLGLYLARRFLGFFKTQIKADKRR